MKDETQRNASLPGASRAHQPLLRIGCVPYLNSRVLVWGLAERTDRYTLEFHPPSVLAEKLRAGTLDVGLVSSIECLRRPAYRVLPGCSVSGRGEMWSIRLFYKGPLEKMRRVALDPASETTNALLRIVLHEQRKLDPEFVTLARGEDPRERGDLDGFLLIGDPALAFRDTRYRALDLLSEWDALTGKPFVFALWLVREGVDLGNVAGLLAEAKREGLKRTGALAREHGEAAGLSLERARAYVSRIVRYDFGEEELAGLACFQRYLLKLGLIADARPVKFYE